MDDSRLAQLTSEIVGAKALAEFMREIMNSLAPEDRVRISAQVADTLVERLRKDDFSFRAVMDGEMRALIKEVVDARRDEILLLAKARVDASFESRVGSIVERLLSDALLNVQKYIATAIEESIRKQRGI